MASVPPPIELSPEQARAWLLAATGLGRDTSVSMPELLAQRRCIQLDPLDPIGPNADLVAMARTPAHAGELEAHTLPGHAFEHFAKERCLLPASAWPAYRDQVQATPQWRHSTRMKRLDPGIVEAVLAEVRDRGPVAVRDLSHRGAVEPQDWSGWKGTAKAATLAIEVLWLQCRVVVVGRGPRVVDLPERALPHQHRAPAPASFARWALMERVEAMGLLPTAKGPCWGQIQAERLDLSAQLLDEGALEAVTLPGTRKRWLAPAGFRDRPLAEQDDHLRILGPLDPLLWDRDLVHRVFGFRYVWEVYKPAAKRQYGWYVCPLLHRGRLVGRFEGRRRRDGTIEVLGLWPEEGFDPDAFDAALTRHAERLSGTGGTLSSRPHREEVP